MFLLDITFGCKFCTLLLVIPFESEKIDATFRGEVGRGKTGGLGGGGRDDREGNISAWIWGETYIN